MPEYKVTKANAKVSNAVRKALEDTRNTYLERDQVGHAMRKLQLMRHTPFVPKTYQAKLAGSRAIKLPVIYRLIQTAVAAVSKKQPQVFVEARNARDRGAADSLAHAGNLLLQSLDNALPAGLFYDGLFKFFGSGWLAQKTQDGVWAGYPLPMQDETPAQYNERVDQFRSEHPLPFRTHNVDPLTFYPPTDTYGEGAVVESGWRSTRETLLALNMEPNGIGGLRMVPMGRGYHELEFPANLPPMTRVSEIWTKNECAVVIDGYEHVLIFENAQGKIPYSYGFADITGVDDPTNFGMSIAYPLFYIAPWIDSMVAIMTAWSLFAAPTPYTTQDYIPGVRTTSETRVEMYRPGYMYHFATGRKPGVLSPPNVGDQLLGYLGFLTDAADRGGLSSLVSGGGVGTRLPALTFQGAMEASLDRLKPGVQSYEKILAGTLYNAFDIITQHGSPIYVNGWEYESEFNSRVRPLSTVIRPSETSKRRRVSVVLPIDSTQDLIAKGTHAQYMVAAKIWDREMAMRFAGVQNVEKTLDAIAADEGWLAALPMLAQISIQENPEIAAFVQEQQMMAAQQQGMGAGLPPASPDAESGFDGITIEAQPVGRNRFGVPPMRGGGARGVPTHEPRGNRSTYPGSTYGRS